MHHWLKSLWQHYIEKTKSPLVRALAPRYREDFLEESARDMCIL